MNTKTHQFHTDNDKIRFKIKTRKITSSLRGIIFTWQVHLFAGVKCVGVVEERRSQFFSQTRSEAIKSARMRIKELRSHRLFVIQLTKRNIADGEGRSCRNCAISQALWSNQERMGFPKYEWSFETSTYAAFADARGIVRNRRYSSAEEARIPTNRLPSVVTNWRTKLGRKIWAQDMVEWTLHFDDWADYNENGLKAWREENGHDAMEPPPRRPSPCFFVLDLDEFKTDAELKPV